MIAEKYPWCPWLDRPYHQASGDLLPPRKTTPWVTAGPSAANRPPWISHEACRTRLLHAHPWGSTCIPEDAW